MQKKKKHNPFERMRRMNLSFELQTDRLIPARKPNLIATKRTWNLVDFFVPVSFKVKIKEDEKLDKYLDLARELKKVVEHEGDGDTHYNWCALNVPKGLEKKPTEVTEKSEEEWRPFRPLH